MPRNPKTIANELAEKIAAVPRFGVPVNLAQGLALASEFMQSTADALIAAGVVPDPAAAVEETPAPEGQ